MLHFARNTPAHCPSGGAAAESEGALHLHPHSVSLLNDHFADRPATDLLTYALSGALGRVALVSSFGAEAAVLLHLAARIDRAVPVLLLDTELLFAETLVYQTQLARHLGLTNVTALRPAAADLAETDPQGELHRTAPSACCALRKSAPLAAALGGFDGWITGRKRYQSGTRATLPLVESDPASGRVKLNPLASWSAADIAANLTRHDLPRHPLVARGYPSIGCAPCTTATAPDEPTRSGRWRGQDRDECGIHFTGGRATRTQAPA